MPSLNQSIVVNVADEYIELYLKQHGCIRTDTENGMETKYWVDRLFAQNKIDVVKFEDFLFAELFWGKRKTINVYKLDRVKDYKYPSDWETKVKEKYDLDSIDFCRILETIPNKENPRKIAAIKHEVNYKGELTRIQILFSCYIQVNDKGGYSDSISYIPVEIDFARKIMLIKAWNRQYIANDDHKAEKMMKHIKSLMAYEFKVLTKAYMTEHQKVLFAMSKSLIYEAYSSVPAYNEIDRIQGVIRHFINEIMELLPLRNVEENENGNKMLSEGVMDLTAEIKNVLEGAVISDYFFDRNFEEIWNLGLEAVVARVKFNDAEKVLTSLSGENTSTPIFCTKTFMSLKNRMEETEKIETLWITKGRKRGNLNLKFEASNEGYLGILISYGIRFNESDMNSALEIYEKYETRINQKTSEDSKS